MHLSESQKIQKGWHTEEAFRKLLDDANIPYLPFCDNTNKFSPSLKEFFKSKRPDVMILLRYIGYLLVDIKHKQASTTYNSFLFNTDEIDKYERFREQFGQEVWFAISNENIEHKKWYWIPSLQVKKGKKEIVTDEGDRCYVVPVSDCITVETFHDLISILMKH